MANSMESMSSMNNFFSLLYLEILLIAWKYLIFRLRWMKPARKTEKQHFSFGAENTKTDNEISELRNEDIEWQTLLDVIVWVAMRWPRNREREKERERDRQKESESNGGIGGGTTETRSMQSENATQCQLLSQPEWMIWHLLHITLYVIVTTEIYRVQRMWSTDEMSFRLIFDRILPI